MRRFVGMMFLIFLASALFAPAADTWKLTVSDKMCGADHSGMNAAKCVASCVKNGDTYVLVAGKEKVYDIENVKDAKISSELAKHAGHTVEVAGVMSKDGKSIKIDSIKMPVTK